MKPLVGTVSAMGGHSQDKIGSCRISTPSSTPSTSRISMTLGPRGITGAVRYFRRPKYLCGAAQFYAAYVQTGIKCELNVHPNSPTRRTTHQNDGQIPPVFRCKNVGSAIRHATSVCRISTARRPASEGCSQ